MIQIEPQGLQLTFRLMNNLYITDAEFKECDNVNSIRLGGTVLYFNKDGSFKGEIIEDPENIKKRGVI